MHDGMPYGPIQGQVHMTLKIRFFHFQNLSHLPFSMGAGKLILHWLWLFCNRRNFATEKMQGTCDRMIEIHFAFIFKHGNCKIITSYRSNVCLDYIDLWRWLTWLQELFSCMEENRSVCQLLSCLQLQVVLVNVSFSIVSGGVLNSTHSLTHFYPSLLHFCCVHMRVRTLLL